MEFFFDLIGVVPIASITAGLHHAISTGHGIDTLPRFLFLFTAIWWAWMSFTWLASAFDNDGPFYRLLVMIIMMGELIFAGDAGYIFETLNMSWGIVGCVSCVLAWPHCGFGPQATRNIMKPACATASGS
ncbi:MAG: low temperature requirement protein A [Paracoccus sp. (in: a-proteobacteria)]